MSNVINTGLNLMNTAYNGAGGIVLSGDAVKGGYFVTDTLKNIPVWTKVKGTLCYCEEDKKFYQFNGETWGETEFDALRKAIEDEATRAIDVENGLADDLKSETLRATAAEEELLGSLGQAYEAIATNQKAIEDENVRAREAEAFISEKVDKEASRAILAEERLLASLIAEEQRALEAEELIRGDLKTNFGEINTLLEEEIERAEKSELALSESLNEEAKKLNILIGDDGNKSIKTIIAERVVGTENDTVENLTIQGLLNYIKDYQEEIGFSQNEGEGTLTEQIGENLAKILDLIAILIGNDKEKSVRTIANEERKEEQTRAEEAEAIIERALKQETGRAQEAETANATEIARVNSVLEAALENNKEGIDSIKELATWVEQHGKDAAEMAKAINQNAADIATEVQRAKKEEEILTQRADKAEAHRVAHDEELAKHNERIDKNSNAIIAEAETRAKFDNQLQEEYKQLIGEAKTELKKYIDDLFASEWIITAEDI